MKKSLIYPLAPIVGMIVFGAIYWNFHSGYEKREADKAAAIRHEKELRQIETAKKNEAAIREANAGVLARKAEREAKEAKQKRDEDLRRTAQEAQEKAAIDRDKFAKQVTQLESDVKKEKEAIAKLEDEKKKANDEVAFLRVYVKNAEDNVKSLQAVVERIAAADAARATAEAAAAAAKNKRDNS